MLLKKPLTRELKKICIKGTRIRVKQFWGDEEYVVVCPEYTKTNRGTLISLYVTDDPNKSELIVLTLYSSSYKGKQPMNSIEVLC